MLAVIKISNAKRQGTRDLKQNLYKVYLSSTCGGGDTELCGSVRRNEKCALLERTFAMRCKVNHSNGLEQSGRQGTWDGEGSPELKEEIWYLEYVVLRE